MGHRTRVSTEEKDMTKLINLTPHSITLCAPDGALLAEIAPSGQVARVTTTPGALTEVAGVPVPVAQPTAFGAVEGLPAAQASTFYIVSTLVAQVAKRADVLSPGTAPADGAIRDEAGRIVGVTRLIASAPIPDAPADGPALVSFEWNDGPNANAEFHRIRFYSPSGEQIEAADRTEVRYEKNGKWSYATVRLTVPAGTIVVQTDQDTACNLTARVWRATPQGREAILTVCGKWAQFATWPPAPDTVDETTWRRILTAHLKPEITAAWDAGATVAVI